MVQDKSRHLWLILISFVLTIGSCAENGEMTSETAIEQKVDLSIKQLNSNLTGQVTLIDNDIRELNTTINGKLKLIENHIKGIDACLREALPDNDRECNNDQKKKQRSNELL